MTIIVFQKKNILNLRTIKKSSGFWRIMNNKEFLIKFSLYLPLYKRYQDPVFLLNTMLKAGQFFSCKKVTYIYRKQHKLMNWTSEKLIDCLRGMTDILSISKENNLYKLHLCTLKEINCDLCMTLFRYMMSNRIKFLMILNQMKQCLDERLIGDKNKYVFEAEKNLNCIQRVKYEKKN